MSDSPARGDIQAVTPIIIDLGKTSRKKAKQLKKGKGPLADQLALAIQQVKEQLGEEAGSGGILPVVALFEKKPRKKSLFPLL